LISVTVTVCGPDEVGAGTRVWTVVEPPLTVGSVMVTVAAGTLTVWPPAVVTETVGTEAGIEDGTETVPPLEVTTVPDGAETSAD
jgi:hypothetical protein